MSWLDKLLPSRAKKAQTQTTDRRASVPEGLWLKCPGCETVLYKTDLEQNQHVCPHCGHPDPGGELTQAQKQKERAQFITHWITPKLVGVVIVIIACIYLALHWPPF